MRKQTLQFKVSVRGILFVLLIIIGIGSFSNMRVNATTVSYDTPSYSSLTPHASISITSDVEFEVFPGAGTAEDPYVIEGYNITTTDNTGIYISGTTKYFTIRNCYVDAEDSGIFLDTVPWGTAKITNNTCNNNNVCGINTIDCGNVTITQNICENNLDGIYLFNSGYSEINNNECKKNSQNGIVILESTDCAVINNLCFDNNNEGIEINTSSDSIVENNTCIKSNYGIRMYNSNSCIIANSTSINSISGIDISACSDITIINNSFDGNNAGIQLTGSDATITNNSLSNNYYYGINLQYSEFCVIMYNLFLENGAYGMDIGFSSDNNIIYHNTFVDNNYFGTSQSSDIGTSNTWYDISTLEGNFWSDWSGSGSYSIDSSAGSADLYPLNGPTVYIGPPIITNMINTPYRPTQLDNIEIEATVTSYHGIQAVTLHYRIDGGTWIESNMTIVLDDLYSCIIGPFAVGELIEYYVSAVDDTEEHNIGFDEIFDYYGIYTSFTIKEFVIILEFQIHTVLILPTIVFLFSVVCVVLKKQRRE